MGQCCSDGVMDQVERALLVVSGDAASSKLVADSQVNTLHCHSLHANGSSCGHKLIIMSSSVHEEILPCMNEVPSHIQAAENSCFKSAASSETLTAPEASRPVCSSHHSMSIAEKALATTKACLLLHVWSCHSHIAKHRFCSFSSQ